MIFTLACVGSVQWVLATLRESCVVFFLMMRRPPRSTLDRSSAASDVYKRQPYTYGQEFTAADIDGSACTQVAADGHGTYVAGVGLSLIHISEPTRPY